MFVKTGRSAPYIPFFNMLHGKNTLDRYINNFRDIWQPYLLRLGLSGLLFELARMAHISGT